MAAGSRASAAQAQPHRPAAGQPWFININFMKVHQPNLPAPEFEHKSLSKSKYADSVVELDTRIGHVMEKLRALGMNTNTLVFYTTDNGAWQDVYPDAAVPLPTKDREGAPMMFDSYDMTPALLKTGKSARDSWFFEGSLGGGMFVAALGLRVCPCPAESVRFATDGGGDRGYDRSDEPVIPPASSYLAMQRAEKRAARHRVSSSARGSRAY